MSSYLVQEDDGSSRFTLEDGSGFLLLETSTPGTPALPGIGGPLPKGRRRRLEVIDQELDWLTTVLTEV